MNPQASEHPQVPSNTFQSDANRLAQFYAEMGTRSLEVQAQLGAQMQALTAQVAAIATFAAKAPVDSCDHADEHSTKPPVFDGKDRRAAHRWLSLCTLYFDNHPSRFPTETSKVSFAASLLRDSALDWFEPSLGDAKAGLPIRASWNVFAAAVMRRLGDPDLKASSQRELVKLRQVGSASAYASKFLQLSSHAGMDDTALIFHFEQHLKPEVRKLLLANPLSGAWPDLQTLVDAAVKADCKLYEISQSFHYASAPASGFGNYRSTPVGQSGPVPMDLSATTTGAPTKRWNQMNEQERAEERDRRRRLGLCYRCGARGHLANECPGGTRILATATVAESVSGNGSA